MVTNVVDEPLMLIQWPQQWWHVTYSLVPAATRTTSNKTTRQDERSDHQEIDRHHSFLFVLAHYQDINAMYVLFLLTIPTTMVDVLVCGIGVTKNCFDTSIKILQLELLLLMTNHPCNNKNYKTQQRRPTILVVICFLLDHGVETRRGNLVTPPVKHEKPVWTTATQDKLPSSQEHCFVVWWWPRRRRRFLRRQKTISDSGRVPQLKMKRNGTKKTDDSVDCSSTTIQYRSRERERRRMRAYEKFYAIWLIDDLKDCIHDNMADTRKISCY